MAFYTNYTNLILLPAVFALTAIGVGFFRRWSLRRELLDLPNERSSHTEPTPRGGGVVICLVSLPVFTAFCLFSNGPLPWGYLIGAVVVGVISWFDDLYTISPVWRILCHALAAGLAVSQFGGFETLRIPFGGLVETGQWGKIIAFLWIVWLINAYNFMDGIDGLAATQAVTAGLGWFVVGYLEGIPAAGLLGGTLAAAAGGFLYHNWPPARIFMGDVGSAFLGYTFAVLPLLAVNETVSKPVRGLLPVAGILLVWLFVFDSVLTFVRRLLKGEKVWRPHRRHIYQELIIAGRSHRFVTLLYTGISVLIGLTLAAALLYPELFGEIMTLSVFLMTAVLFAVRFRRSGSGFLF